MSEITIKDKLTLRQFAISQATITMTAAIGLGKVPYDINNHLAIANAIENYIKGNIELPEVEDDLTRPWSEKMLPLQDSLTSD